MGSIYLNTIVQMIGRWLHELSFCLSSQGGLLRACENYNVRSFDTHCTSRDSRPDFGYALRRTE
jgi:hypothetical protein